MPCAIAARVRTLHGAIIMPSVAKEPLDIEAPWSFGLWQTEAIACTSSGEYGVSCASVLAPHLLITR